MMDSKFRGKLITIHSILVLYLILFVLFGQLKFPIRKDEDHYWPTALEFSRDWVPTIDLLRNYGELSTPLSFTIFGTIEHLFHGGIFAGRLVNLILSFGILTILVFISDGRSRTYLVSVIGVLIYPYFIACSTHLYTDIIATFFVLIGLIAYLKGLNLMSCLSFVLAISARQYMLAFPLGIFIFEILNLIKRRFTPTVRRHSACTELGVIRAALDGGARTLPHRRGRGLLGKFQMFLARSEDANVRRPTVGRLLYQAVACLSIMGWILLWGNFGPGLEVLKQNVRTISLFKLIPEHSLYFLSCLGFYFVIPEAILLRRTIFIKNFRKAILYAASLITTERVIPAPIFIGINSSRNPENTGFRVKPGMTKRKRLMSLCIVSISLLVAFFLFPPYQNVNYTIPTMGYMDKLFRMVAGDFLRMAIFYILALIACLRFLSIDLESLFVLSNGLLMLKSHIAWDKYLLPVIVVLWFFNAIQSQNLMLYKKEHEWSSPTPPPSETVSQYEKTNFFEKGRGGRVKKI